MRLQRTAAGAARFSWQICNQFMLEWTDRRDDDDDGDDDNDDDENDENCSRVGRYATAFCLAASFLKRRKGGVVVMRIRMA